MKTVSHNIENSEPFIGPKSIPLKTQNKISTLKFNGPLKISEQTYLITVNNDNKIAIYAISFVVILYNDLLIVFVGISLINDFKYFRNQIE